MIISPTTTRVEEHTDADINDEIYNRTKNNVLLYASAGPSAIDQRLRELEVEWDIERVLEANAASFSLMGLALGAFLDRRWLILPCRRRRLSPATCPTRLVPAGSPVSANGNSDLT